MDGKHTGDLWVFGYGSLMWRPDFPFVERRRARLAGYRRCFCVYSTHHRGSPERPGLVLGLDRGGVCEGMVFRVAASDVATVRAYLRAREQVNGVYREAVVTVRLHGEPPREVSALAYIVERAHPSYAGRLPLGIQCCLIRGARGRSGANLDYLINTVAHLKELGIDEAELNRILALIGPHFAGGIGNGLASPRAAGLLGACCRIPVRVPRLPTAQRRRFLYRRHLAKLVPARE